MIHFINFLCIFVIKCGINIISLILFCLGHPNVKVFVTQGGLQSIEEAITRGVPMVGLPFLGDQPKNVKKLNKWGIGKSLNPMEMTPDMLKAAIMEVATNLRFVQNNSLFI